MFSRFSRCDSYPLSVWGRGYIRAFGKYDNQFKFWIYYLLILQHITRESSCYANATKYFDRFFQCEKNNSISRYLNVDKT